MSSGAIVLVVAIVFGSVLAALAIIAGAVVRLLGGGGRSKSGPQYDEESRIIQELYQGFTKMESRIESLETLLLERETEHK